MEAPQAYPLSRCTNLWITQFKDRPAPGFLLLCSGLPTAWAAAGLWIDRGAASNRCARPASRCTHCPMHRTRRRYAFCAGRSLTQSPVKLLDVWPDSPGVGGGLGSGRGGNSIGGPPFGCFDKLMMSAPASIASCVLLRFRPRAHLLADERGSTAVRAARLAERKGGCALRRRRALTAAKEVCLCRKSSSREQ